MKRYLPLLICFLALILLESFTTDVSWEEAYSKNETIIYTRTTETGIKEFKAITTVNAELNTVLAVMIDYKNHPEWMRAMKDCKLVEQATPRTRYLYYSIDMPWPLWDRDLVSKSTFYLQKDGSVLMRMKAMPKVKPEDPDHVRIQDSEGYWHVSAIGPSKTKIIYQYKADPVGIPAYFVNMFLLEAPKATFEGLFEQVKLSRYKNITPDWLYKK